MFCSLLISIKYFTFPFPLRRHHSRIPTFETSTKVILVFLVSNLNIPTAVQHFCVFWYMGFATPSCSKHSIMEYVTGYIFHNPLNLITSFVESSADKRHPLLQINASMQYYRNEHKIHGNYRLISCQLHQLRRGFAFYLNSSIMWNVISFAQNSSAAKISDKALKFVCDSFGIPDVRLPQKVFKQFLQIRCPHW